MRSALRGLRPWHVRTLLAREPGGLSYDQRRELCGPHREGDEPKPMMHEGEKSDSAIVAKKLANKAEQSAAESVERRAGAEENASQDGTLRTPSRVGVSSGLDRVRTAARLDKKV